MVLLAVSLWGYPGIFLASLKTRELPASVDKPVELYGRRGFTVFFTGSDLTSSIPKRSEFDYPTAARRWEIILSLAN